MGISHKCPIRCIVVGPCRPRWMKMVDNLYSGNPQETNSLSKLVHYCLHQPDKLDRIAKYLSHHLSQDVHRRNDMNITIGIEAITKLIQACHGQRPVLATSFLRMVLLLLETNRIDHQILAAKSFVEFSQIEDDTPNYFKEYNDLIDHFSLMAHASLSNPKDQNVVRLAGICGIQGVVRKTVDEQLHLDVVHACNMDKIIPSILFNISEKPHMDSDDAQEDPSQEAVYVFQDVCRSCYNNIKPVVFSILTHLDNHKLWAPSDFPLLVFQYLLSSIENTQTAHGLVKILVAHLNTNESDFTLPERTCMVQVIGLTVTSLAKNSIGPDVFHNFKALLQILRASIDHTYNEGRPDLLEANGAPIPTSEEHQFQDAIVTTIAEFAKNLSDTQKIEILKFILNFEPMARHHAEYGQRPRPLSMVLLQTMLTVATQYQTVAISNALNYDFLNLLLRGVAVDPDPAIRIIVQKILHTLIDRHGNTESLLNVQTYLDHPLDHYFIWEEPQRQDILFMKKTGVLFTENIYHQLLDPTNRVDCLEHLICTIGLVALEMGADQVITELFRLILAVQHKICRDDEEEQESGGESEEYLDARRGRGSVVLLLPHRCALHAMLASSMSLLVQLVNLPKLLDHVKQVIESRNMKAPYLLPALAFNRNNTKDSYPSTLELTDDLLFSPNTVANALASADYDATSLSVPYHPVYERLYNSASIMPDTTGFTGHFHQPTAANGLSRSHSGINARNGKSGHGIDGGGGSTDATGAPSAEYINGTGAASLYANHPRNSFQGPGPTRSDSSYSLTDSISSIADSIRMGDEMLSFANMHRVITDSYDYRHRGLANEDIRYINYGNPEFNDIVARQREKTLTSRAQYAELLDDISMELQPLTANALSMPPLCATPTPDPVGNLSFARKLVSTPSKEHSQLPSAQQQQQPPTDYHTAVSMETNTNMMRSNYASRQNSRTQRSRSKAATDLARGGDSDRLRYCAPAMWERDYGTLFLN